MVGHTHVQLVGLAVELPDVGVNIGGLVGLLVVGLAVVGLAVGLTVGLLVVGFEVGKLVGLLVVGPNRERLRRGISLGKSHALESSLPRWRF